MPAYLVQLKTKELSRDSPISGSRHSSTGFPGVAETEKKDKRFWQGWPLAFTLCGSATTIHRVKGIRAEDRMGHSA